MPVQVNLLRGFELMVEGASVEVPSGAQRVVAYLALRERPQLRTSVASALWLDQTEQRASANLRTALWKMHGLRDRVISTRGSYLGIADQVDVDFADVVRGARGLIERPPASEEVPSPPAASVATLDLLSGDLLPDWDEDWILFERERLRQLRIHAIEALSSLLRRAGRHAEAVEAGLLAVSADPLRETAHRVLIEAHLSEGNVADARRQFDRFRLLLWDSLGIMPSTDLCRLVGVVSGDSLRT
jgi:DNA-binding SARP family transcriptional activator